MKVWRAWVAAEFRRAAWVLPWLIGAHLLSVGAYTRWAWDLSDRMRWLIGLAQMGLSLWVVVTSLWEGAPLRGRRFLATRPHTLLALVLSKAAGLWLISVLPFMLVEAVVAIYHGMPGRIVALGAAQACLLGTAGLAAAFPAFWWWKRWPEAVIGLVVGLPLALVGAAWAYGEWWFPGVPLWPVAVLGSCGLFALAGWIGLGMGRFGWWARIGLFPPFAWLCLIGGLEIGFRPPPMDETVVVSLAKVEAEAGSRYDFYQRDQPLKLLRITVPTDPVDDAVERRWSEPERYYSYDDWHGEGADAALNCVLHRYLTGNVQSIEGQRAVPGTRNRLPLGIRMPHADGDTLSVKPDVTAVETQLAWEVVADIPFKDGASVSNSCESWSIRGRLGWFTVRHVRGLSWLGGAGDEWMFPNQKESFYLYDSVDKDLRRIVPHQRNGWGSGSPVSSVRVENLEIGNVLMVLQMAEDFARQVRNRWNPVPPESLVSGSKHDCRLLVLRPRTVKRIAHSWKSPEEVSLKAFVSPWLDSANVYATDGKVYFLKKPPESGTDWLAANPVPSADCSDDDAARWIGRFFTECDPQARTMTVHFTRNAEAIREMLAKHPEVALRQWCRLESVSEAKRYFRSMIAGHITREVVMAVPESHTDPFVAGIALRRGFFPEIAPAIAKWVRGGAWIDLTDIIERVPAKIGLTEAEWLDYFRMRPLGSVYRALCGTVVRKEALDAEVERILRNWTDSRGIDDPLELPDLALAVGRPEAPAWVAARLKDPDDDLRLNPALIPMITRYFVPSVKRDFAGYQDFDEVRSWFLSCDPSGFVFNPKRGKYEQPTSE
ncbi:MAG: hypothetical protein J0M04_15160 [Verrucomicrobia bacterium]|nr:hypothetical protein [Verrucomicrobiota bacterium]